MNTNGQEQYITTRLDEALEKGWIVPCFQPIVRTISDRFAGVEELARWMDPAYGCIMPGIFVPILEKAGLIYKVDCFMLTEALKVQRRRIDAGLEVGPISVNFSRQDFDKLDMVAFIQGEIQKYGIRKDLIAIELTESMLAQSKDKMTQIVKDLRSDGFQIWMDDFGGGYSSLIFLNDYTLDVIKLDMGFLRSFSAVSKEIMKSTVDMAKRLGIRTLAEGVETEAHVRFLKEIGCDMMQGYYFSRPRSHEEMEDYLGHLHVSYETIEWKAFYDKADACVIDSDVPRAVMEYDMANDHIQYLFLNKKQREELRSLGRITKSESEFVLNSRYNPLHGKMLEFYRQAIDTGEEVTLYVSDNSHFIRVVGRMVARLHDRCILQLSVADVTEDRTQKIGEVLNKSLSDLVLLFDDVHVLNPEKNTADNLINNFGINAGLKNQDNLREGLRHFCEHMVYPDDRERYWAYADPDTMTERILKMPNGTMRDYFRVLLPDGNGKKAYKWREFNLLLIPGSHNQRILSAIKDAEPTVDYPYVSQTMYAEPGKKDDV